MSQTKTNYAALSTLITVFFFWGFFAAGNSIFIPFCKDKFELDQFQSQLIDFAFYFAYYIGALILFGISMKTGKDPILKWGYKKSIVYGLLFSSIGALAMIFFLYFNQFAGLLLGLFIVALGFSVQQTSANPFLILLGDEKTGSNRVSLGGAINSIGGVLGPIIVGLALFGSVTYSPEAIHKLSMKKVMILYGLVALLFILIALLFAFSKQLPDGKLQENTDNDASEKAKNKSFRALMIMTALLVICYAPVMLSYRSAAVFEIKSLETFINSMNGSIANYKVVLQEKTEQVNFLKAKLEEQRLIWLMMSFVVVVATLIFSFIRSKKEPESWGAMRFPQLILGMLAIFIYVGVEVAVGSNLSELLMQQEFGAYSSSETAGFISLYWGSLMMGRWASAVHVFNLNSWLKGVFVFIMPYIAFLFIIYVSFLAKHDIRPFFGYAFCILLLIVGFFLGKNKPSLTLFIFGLLGCLTLLLGLIPTGYLSPIYDLLGMENNGILSIYFILSSGLFCSIIWPCIFSLSLAGLGKYQSQGSSFLIMMILGGAIIPPLQGKLSDVLGIQNSFIIGVLCFAYLTIFALWVKNILKQQKIFMG